jgi:hypothetical protein
MRRIIGAVGVATFVGLGAVALPAGAAAGGPVRTVEFTGTSTFDITGPCPLIHQVHDATLDTNRDATLHIDSCVDVFGSGGQITIAGTYTIDSPGRRSIAGTATGVVGGTPASGTCPVGLSATALDFELTPAPGNGRQPDPSHLVGTWCSPGTPNISAPIFGTLTGELPPGVH